eukprot:TRINITY_DN5336_c0_g1_i1.p1 TRINITY_DN5336_c0_g1~~TRINITY_DN5336_c0_g1_i1.p1  ORF type:complete len:195 (-),score=14.57 TRINITY_DN5336_c0_g1_i1:226-810(-)
MKEKGSLRFEYIFGYGSLMWNPGFNYIQAQQATLSGYQRDMCMYSFRSRGSKKNPGLCLGLLANASAECAGIVFQIDPSECKAVWDILEARENQPLKCYDSKILPVKLHNSNVPALVYIPVNPHEQFAYSNNQTLTMQDKVRIITTTQGTSGTSLAYLQSTLASLSEIGITDAALSELLESCLHGKSNNNNNSI